jgi:hypothetical protein
MHDGGSYRLRVPQEVSGQAADGLEDADVEEDPAEDAEPAEELLLELSDGLVSAVPLLAGLLLDDEPRLSVR